jgi:basic membrane protein A and related proteins
MKRSIILLVALVVVVSLALSACQPQTIVETVEVEKIVEVEKEVEVEKIVEVEKEVEVEVEKIVEVEAAGGDAMYADALAGKTICAVLSGPVNDAGWNTSAYLGLTNLRSKYGMNILYREHTLPEETSDLLREYAESGCDFLYAHGFEYFDQINEVAAEYPELQFVQTSRGSGEDPNVIGLSFVSGEEGYFGGLEGCQRSATGKIAIIVGQTYPNLGWNQSQAQVAAQWLVDEGKVDSCEVEWLEVGDWSDAAKAKELTTAAIEQGIDVFIMVADAGDSGVVEAIKEAREAGKEAWAISGVKDKNYLGPDFIIGGYEELVLMQVELAVEAWVDNGMAAVGAGMPVGMRDGAIQLAPIYGLLPIEVEEEIFQILGCYIENGMDCEMMSPDAQFRTDL